MAGCETESIDASEDDDISDEEDYGKSVQMLGSKLSSWYHILQSIKKCQKSGEIVNFETILSAAQQAFLCEDFSSAIQLFAIAFNQHENAHYQSSLSIKPSLKAQLLEMRDIVCNAINCCTTLVSQRSRQARGQVVNLHRSHAYNKNLDLKQSVGSIISSYAEFGLESTMLLSQASAFFLGCKDFDQALDLSDKAVMMDPLSIVAQEVHENICCHLVERWHFIMLNDECRNHSYEKAIIKGINQYPGNVSVCDVGCGTGLLSLIASNQLNCKSVYAIEKMKIMTDVARKVFAENLSQESASKVRLVNKISSKMSIPHDLPNQAQILVTETFDAGLFGEGILPTLCHAWANLLNQENGEMHSLVVPSSAKLYIQAIESTAILKESRLTSDANLYSLNHRSVCICSTVGMCAPDPYTTHDLKRLPGGYRVLSEPYVFMEIDFNNLQELSELEKGCERQFSLTVTESGHLDALAMWFSLNLLDTKEISTHTDRHGCWEQAVFPVNPCKLKQNGASLTVVNGDTLKVSQLVKGAQHSLSVTDIDRVSQNGKEILNDEVREEDRARHPFLASTLEWCKSQIYCLSSSEVAALNNTCLSEALCLQLQKFLSEETSHTQGQPDFIHFNHGFSPLCLQALKMGYKHAWAVANSPVHQVLNWKLAQENGIDISNLTLMKDAVEVCLDIESEREHTREDNCEMENIGDSKNEAEEEAEMNVVVLDVVDFQGRLLEDLNENISVMRESLSSYSRVCVLPHCIDVYGVLIESEELLTRSRVISDEHTLGYKIASFVNRFSTRNHQGIDLQSLPHTKLCKPFKMFSIDLKKTLLGSRQLPEQKFETGVSQNSLHTSYQGSSSQDSQFRHPTSHKTSQCTSSINNNIVYGCLEHAKDNGATLKPSEPQAYTKESSIPQKRQLKGLRDNAQWDIYSESNALQENKCDAKPHTEDDFDQSADITVTITASGTVTALVYWFNLHMCDNKDAPSSKSLPFSSFSSLTSHLAISQPTPAAVCPDSHTDLGNLASSHAAKASDSTKQSRHPASGSLTSNPCCQTSLFTPQTIPIHTDTPSHHTCILASPGNTMSTDVPQNANSLLSEMTITSKPSSTNSASTEYTPPSSSKTCGSNYFTSANNMISTMDPTHHWQQAAVMTDPGKPKKVVNKDNQLLLHCVMGSSAFSFSMDD